MLHCHCAMLCALAPAFEMQLVITTERCSCRVSDMSSDEEDPSHVGFCGAGVPLLPVQVPLRTGVRADGSSLSRE
ncbi:hypothetical protein N658DRAFT_306709 [Parathielavia hyrcaniae]|uniref:Secreted protein n=1 Tax=Parathielavia hyrcaniae TaxID=113614 RepID=A0AAN6Q477_9PEZI|nr:hypothetical protein N658DRAFT_306709 [Parathielavia hyrcaniae]